MRKSNLLIDRYPQIYAQLVAPDESLTFGTSKVVDWHCRCGYRWSASVSSRTSGGKPKNCPACTGRVIAQGVNDLKTTHPEIWEELVDKSLMVSRHTTKKLLWRCDLNHTWEAPPRRRVAENTGCPYCSGNLVLPGFNDIATTDPAAAAMLVDQSLATVVSRGSSRMLAWKCEKGHRWRARVLGVVNSLCPFCSGKKLSPEHSLATMHPDLSREWSSRNTLEPDEVFPNAAAKVWWVCDQGHEWRANIYSRARGTGCPKCIMHGTSHAEQEFANRIEGLGFHIVRNTRQIIPPLELDIYIPDLHVGIEFNGEYWHSDEERLVRKQEACDLAGVRLITVWYNNYQNDIEGEIERVVRIIKNEED